ncbi:uncharacterized protein LOC132863901 isoform X2 [Tachysurus vachellii]|uniref:uncharacterized protein LOC132863901 isoform X2 n=1 Tax=Tachysurus vachellii TaxID=175792 RepID=UPI00296ADDCB|nr:uncharacterized protein LOC132863901 isoform X2 [Tachysurus vachellii]
MRASRGESMTPSKWMLSVEREVVLGPFSEAFVEGLAALFATYYNLNLAYQDDAACTLEFIQSFYSPPRAAPHRQPPTPTSHYTPHVKAGDRRASCAVTVTVTVGEMSAKSSVIQFGYLNHKEFICKIASKRKHTVQQCVSSATQRLLRRLGPHQTSIDIRKGSIKKEDLWASTWKMDQKLLLESETRKCME